MGEIDDPSIPEAKVDDNSRPAKAGMRLGGGVRIREPHKPRNTRRELKDPSIVDLVDNAGPIFFLSYIGGGKAEIEAFGNTDGR
jgi:hypothetical protein